jgi:hypothetical protein
MLSKIILVILFLSFAFVSIYAQPKWTPEVYSGVSAGQENYLLNAPHFCLKLSNTKSKLKTYIGSDIGIWFVFASALSTSIYTGVQHKMFIAETGMGNTIFGYSIPQGGTFYVNYVTLNSKIGIAYKSVILKAGPTFVLNRNAKEEQGKFMTLNKIPFTVSLGFIFKNDKGRTRFRNYLRI